jgi:hypothetical protein
LPDGGYFTKLSVVAAVHFPPPPRRRDGWIRFESGGHSWTVRGAVFMKYTAFAWQQFLRTPSAQLRFEGGYSLVREGDEVVFSAPAELPWRAAAAACDDAFNEVAKSVSAWLVAWATKALRKTKTRRATPK